MCSSWVLFRVRQCRNTVGMRTKKVLEQNRNARRNARKQCWNTQFSLASQFISLAVLSRKPAGKKCWRQPAGNLIYLKEFLLNKCDLNSL